MSAQNRFAIANLYGKKKTILNTGFLFAEKQI